MFFDKFSAISFAVITGLSVSTAAVATGPGDENYSFSQEVIFYTTEAKQCVAKKRPLIGAHALIGIDTEAC